MATTVPSPTDFRSQIEEDTARFVKRIGQIDRILQEPVKSLLRFADPHDEVERTGNWPEAPTFPTWIGPRGPIKNHGDVLTNALCIATLQTMAQQRRRFADLDGHALLKKNDFRQWIVSGYTRVVHDQTADPSGKRYFKQLADTIFHSTFFGGLNPHTAAQILRTLMDAGEEHAHGGVGFLAFFAMIWPLYRRFPDPLNLGARLEPSQPSAYVTAKCLLPVLIMARTCTQRARYLDDIAESLGKLEKLTKYPVTYDRRSVVWRFTTTLDELSATLSHLAPISIDSPTFSNAETEVRKCAQSMHLNADLGTILTQILGIISTAVDGVVAKTKSIHSQADLVVKNIETEIVLRLKNDLSNVAEKYKLRLSQDHLQDDEQYEQDYREDLATAGQDALAACKQAVDALNDAMLCRDGKDDTKVEDGRSREAAGLEQSLHTLAKSNRTIAKMMDEVARLPAAWCDQVVDREIAHASAANLAAFDAAELAGGLLAAARASICASDLQVRDAVAKAVTASQPDGSWRLGHPYFSPDDELGIRPASADIVWMLASSIALHPSVDVADEALFKFVDWLDRTRQTVRVTWPASEDWKAAGWGADRMRHGTKIHLATTAYAINALLEIRQLVEYRLWDLCRIRFKILSSRKPLTEIDPVDMTLPHNERLHTVLTGLARDAADARKAKSARFAFVLHGPPGSSKTALIEALSAEMWKDTNRWGKGDARLVRITPADFTRMGEDRIDSEARLIFDLLSHVRGVTILFDEIDDLLRERDRGDSSTHERPSFIELVIPAMLNRLQDLRDACYPQEICFLLGTNYIDHVEPALIRPGRIDKALPVVYPDYESRVAIVGRIFREEEEKSDGPRHSESGIASEAVQRIAAKTGGASWNEVARIARKLSQQKWETYEEMVRELDKQQVNWAPRTGYHKRLVKHWARSEFRNEYVHICICEASAPNNEKIPTLLNKWVKEWEGLRGVPSRSSKVFRKELTDALARRNRVANAVSNGGSAHSPMTAA